MALKVCTPISPRLLLLDMIYHNSPILLTAVHFLPDCLEVVSSCELADSWLEYDTSRCLRTRFFVFAWGISASPNATCSVSRSCFILRACRFLARVRYQPLFTTSLLCLPVEFQLPPMPQVRCLEVGSSCELADSWLEYDTSRCLRTRFFVFACGISASPNATGSVSRSCFILRACRFLARVRY